MFNYFVYLDGIDGFEAAEYTVRNWWELVGYVNAALEELGGGHADIYDEEGEFVEDVEV